MMMSKTTIISGFVFLIGLAANASAVDRDWTNAGGDRLWRTAANWSGGAVPTSADKAAIRNAAILGPIIDSNTTAAANVIVLGDWSSASDTLDMTGGSLTVGQWFSLGYYVQNSGTFTISAGTVTIGSYMYVGNGGTGTVTISGGSLTVAATLSVAQQTGSTGRVNLTGGTITAGALNITSGGRMNITNGTLIIDGNQIATIRSYEIDYRITAFNGAGKLAYEYNIANPGKTTVTAVAGAVVSWDNGGGNNLWSTAANWNPDGLPEISTIISIGTAAAAPIINSPTAAAGFQIRVGAVGGANLTMNGGSLNVGQWLMIGIEALGRPGTFTMNGGTINLGVFSAGGGHLWLGYISSGTFTMNGGTLNAPGRFGLGFSGGSAAVHLDGGTITAGSFSMTSSCSMDITGGTLIIDGDQTATISSYKNSGWMTAFGGVGTLVCEYNTANPGKTTVTAIAPVAGDMDKDRDVDIDDLVLFANDWLDPNSANAANFDGQGRVDFKDFAILAVNWIKGIVTNWHIVTTQYPTDDLVVTPYQAGDFGIVGDGVTDVTNAIQSALTSVSNLGGGTLFLPAGNYKISGNLTIPGRVTLRGEWQKPEIGSPIVGTILQAYAGRGDANAAPFIGLSNCSGVKGLAIWYPEQLAGDIRPYPPAFQRISGTNHTIENVTFVNAYFGFTTYNTSITACPFVRNIYGTPLKIGIEFDCLADIGRLETVHFSPDYWRYSGLPNAPTANEHAQWIYDNGTGLIMRRIDWSYSAYVTVEGYNIGLSILPSRYDGVFSNGQCYAYTLRNCKTGVYFEDNSAPGMLLSRFDIEQAQVGVHFSTSASQPALFHTCSIDASDKAVLNEGAAMVMMQNCDIQHGTVKVNGGYLTIVNSDFGSTTTSHIELASSVHGASILGNRFSGTPQIINNTSYPVYIDHTALAVAALPAYDYKKPQSEFKPAKSSIFVVTKYPYNAKGDGTTDDTAAFQTALADAAANGGGIVFVPGGDYRLNSTLTIPAGVELRGVFDVPHQTSARGSVLNIYAGRNQENGTPFIQIESGAGIRGLTLHYPEQIYNASDTVNYGMVPYPFMIRGLGSDIYIINVAATIPYQLLDLATYRCDNHYVDYIQSTALKTGIHVGGASVGGQIHNCQLNPSSYTHASAYYASIPPNASDGIHQYLWNTARPYVFGNMSEEVLHQNFVFGALYGVHLVEESGFGPSGHCLGMGADQGTRAMQIDAVGSAAMDMINTQLVTVDSTNGRYIETGNSFDGTLRLFNTACWGIADHSVVVNSGRLELLLFNNVKAGAVAYDVQGTAALSCISADVLNYVDTFLLIGPNATAEFISNIINTSEAQMPVNSSNVTSIGNLRIQ
jgi:hypothetical protein